MSYKEFMVDLPEGKIGSWEISKFTVKEKELSETLSFMKTGRGVPAGTYTRITRNGKVIMSDTPDEIRDHYCILNHSFIRNNEVKHALIAGLGLGMVLNGLAMKGVPEITVIEISQDVIDLVANHYKEKYPDTKINFICADIFEWVSPKGIYYDIAWFDIWDDLCLDNLAEMTKLHRKYGKKASWKESWGRSFLLRQRARTPRWYL